MCRQFSEKYALIGSANENCVIEKCFTILGFLMEKAASVKMSMGQLNLIRRVCSNRYNVGDRLARLKALLISGSCGNRRHSSGGSGEIKFSMIR